MKNESHLFLSVIGLLIVVGIMTYILVGHMFALPDMPNSPKKPAIERTGEVAPDIGYQELTEAENRAVLNTKTDILGQAAYNSDGEVLGTLYDAYVRSDDGTIRWISINVEGHEKAPLVKLQADLVQSFGENGPVIVNISKDEMMEYPAQQRHEDDLVGFVSIRSLPGTPIQNTSALRIAEVTHLTYNNGAIDKVYFKVLSPLTTNPDEQFFMLPFEHLQFTNLDNPYNERVGVALTERQAGAIEAYSEVQRNR